MQGTIWYEENGKIVAFASHSRSGNSTSVDGVDDKLSLQVSDMDALSMRSLYVHDGLVIPRPALEDLPVVGNVVDFSSVPIGSSASVFNEANDEYVVVDFSDPLELVDPGVYRVTVTPPFPYLKHEQTIEVA